MAQQIEKFTKYVKEQKEILDNLSRLERKDFDTKKDYILRLKQVTRPLVEQGYYDGVVLHDLASFIHSELLSKRGIYYNKDGSYYSLFTEEEKRTEFNPTSSGKARPKISSLPLEKQTNDKHIDKLREYSRAEVREPHDYPVSLYLKKIVESSNLAVKQAESLLSKLGKAYFFTKKFDEMFPTEKDLQDVMEESNNTKKKNLQEMYDQYNLFLQNIRDIESELGDTDQKIKDINEIIAQERFVSKQLDERNKITFLEKWNVIIANIEVGISAIAKKLGVNKKHLTNNVRPTENPVTHAKNLHHDYISWFTHIEITSPKGETFVFDAKDYFDQQIERGKLSLPFKPMILRNCEIDTD